MQAGRQALDVMPPQKAAAQTFSAVSAATLPHVDISTMRHFIGFIMHHRHSAHMHTFRTDSERALSASRVATRQPRLCLCLTAVLPSGSWSSSSPHACSVAASARFSRSAMHMRSVVLCPAHVVQQGSEGQIRGAVSWVDSGCTSMSMPADRMARLKCGCHSSISRTLTIIHVSDAAFSAAPSSLHARSCCLQDCC